MADARLVAGLALLAGLAAAVALGPWLWPLDPTFIDPDPVRMLAARNLPGSAAHPLGTDQLGRDLLARLLQGGRISLAVGLSGGGMLAPAIWVIHLGIFLYLWFAGLAEAGRDPGSIQQAAATAGAADQA